MNMEEAMQLLNDQPIGTYLITAVPVKNQDGTWTASAFLKTWDGWASKAGIRVGHPERFEAHNLAPIITYNETMNFIWGFS